MRISLLLEREPFGRILEETLPPLLSALSGRPPMARTSATLVTTAAGRDMDASTAHAVGRPGCATPA